MTDRKWANRWFSALCTIPWLVISAAYIEVCLARLFLARWPSPMTDDPKQIAIAPLHLLVVLLFLSLAAAIPMIIVLAVWNWRKLLSDWRYSAQIGVFAIGVASLCILITYDPGHVFD
jgi:hypothetical protein